jgi:hypothetical protein
MIHMTQPLPHFNAKTVAAIGTIIDTMLQQRVTTFQITYDEKKRILDTAKLIAELLHGASDPHFHAIAHYQISSLVYATKTVLTLEIVYLEDANQLQYVTQKVQQIIAQIITPSMHLHQKIMAIHDWITTNVQYDSTLQRRTAYDGLQHKSTVCSGYASLFWHLCTAAAIPCRVVTGIGKFEAHAWNMVQLDNYWYHIDSTWSTVEDQHTPFSVYRFYLLNDKEIQRTHSVTQLTGQKPFPHALMQYREHLHQLGRALPRLRNTIQHIQQKTGLAYLEPEYTVVGIAQLHKRMTLACQKRQSRVLFGYRGAQTSAKHDLRDVLESLKSQKIYNFSLKAMMYPMPHGFTDDTVLIDVQITNM